jgi:hypothetical protein
MRALVKNWKWLPAAAALCCALCMPLSAQSGGDSTASGTNTGQDTDRDGSTAPTTESLIFNPFGEEVGSRMHASGSVDYRYEYDDNVFASSLFKLSDHISTLSGRFSLGVRKKRYQFQLHYAPNYRIHANYDSRNAFSQSLSNSWQYMFTGRTSLQWNGSLSDRSNASNSGLSFEDVGGVIVPVFHATGLQNDARVLTSHGGLTLSHRSSARTTFTAGVDGGTVNFFELGASPLLSGLSQEQFSVGSNASWEYQFQRGRFVGVTARHQYLGFMTPASHVNYEQVELEYRQQFRNGYAFKIGAGPGFTQNSQPGQRLNDFSYAIDASLSKTARNYRMALAYGRGTRLGSLQGAIVSDTASAVFSRTFLRRWDAGGSINYSRSSNTLGVVRDLESVGIGINAGYRVSRDLEITARFNHTNQFGNSGSLFSSDFDRNTISAGLSYRFGTEQGR